MSADPLPQIDALIALGFNRAADGTFTAPSGSVVTLTPTYDFFELRVSLASGGAVTVVLHKRALKISREPSACDAPEADKIDDHLMRGVFDDETD